MAEHLFLKVRDACKYLDCSRSELLSWIPPDRHLPSDAGPDAGARLWLRQTLDVAKPQIAALRERDREAAAARAAQIETELEAARTRRKGTRKGGAVLAGKVCELLGCSRTELNRWAADGRLVPDGEVVLFGLFPKAVKATLKKSASNAKIA